MWGCKTHWALIPKDLQRKVWQAYRPGQEVDKTPSRQYVHVAREVRDWINWYLEQQPRQPEQVTLWIDEASNIPDHIIKKLGGAAQ